MQLTQLPLGYDTGQISGFVQMNDFLCRFADQPCVAFSNSREGTIVGLLSIGTLFGVLSTGPIADKLGRRLTIVLWCIVFMVGVVIQIATSRAWVQIAIGRLVAGFGVGGLSVMTPMYQSETAPRQIRGALVSCYQLFITLGILGRHYFRISADYMTDLTHSGIPDQPWHREDSKPSIMENHNGHRFHPPIPDGRRNHVPARITTLGLPSRPC